MAFSAIVRISGAGRLAEFRERLRWLMVRDPDAEDYTEHHGADGLEYRFEVRKGLPFPAFAQASRDFPELRVEAEWSHGGERGRAVIENGQLVEQAAEAAAPGALQIDVAIAGDGRVILAMACRESERGLGGYAASATQQTCFRYADDRLERIAVDEADRDLKELALAFAEEWLWYDEADDAAAAFQRARYADYGYEVRGANLKSAKLALLRRAGESRYSTLGEAGRRAREALLATWAEKGG